MHRNMDFSGQNLRGRSFYGQDLSGANFRHADLRGADFRHTVLEATDFRDAQLGRRSPHFLKVIIFLLLVVAAISLTISLSLVFEFKDVGVLSSLTQVRVDSTIALATFITTVNATITGALLLPPLLNRLEQRHTPKVVQIDNPKEARLGLLMLTAMITTISATIVQQAHHLPRVKNSEFGSAPDYIQSERLWEIAFIAGLGILLMALGLILSNALLNLLQQPPRSRRYLLIGLGVGAIAGIIPGVLLPHHIAIPPLFMLVYVLTLGSPLLGILTGMFLGAIASFLARWDWTPVLLTAMLSFLLSNSVDEVSHLLITLAVLVGIWLPCGAIAWANRSTNFHAARLNGAIF